MHKKVCRFEIIDGVKYVYCIIHAYKFLLKERVGFAAVLWCLRQGVSCTSLIPFIFIYGIIYVDPNGFSGLGKLTTLTLIFDYAMELYYEMYSHNCNSVCKQVELPPSLLHCYGTTTTHCLHLNFLLNNTFLTIKIQFFAFWSSCDIQLKAHSL